MNVCSAFQVYCEVAPKRLALAQANTELETATAKLLNVRKKLDVSEFFLIQYHLKNDHPFTITI